MSHSSIQTAAWSPDSRYLLLAERGSSSFHAIHMGDKPPPAHGAYLRTEDLSVHAADGSNGSKVQVGGAIRQLEWDAAGERLAVTFETSDLIALYSSRLSPTLEFSPKCVPLLVHCSLLCFLRHCRRFPHCFAGVSFAVPRASHCLLPLSHSSIEEHCWLCAGRPAS